jgi:hypothetical protein
VTLKPLTIKALLSDAPSGAAIPPGRTWGRAGVIQANEESVQDKSWLLPQRPEDTKWLEGEEADKPRLLGGGWDKSKIAKGLKAEEAEDRRAGALRQRPFLLFGIIHYF